MQDAKMIYKDNDFISCIYRYLFNLSFRITVQFRFLQYLNLHNKFRRITGFLIRFYTLRTAKLGLSLHPDTKIGAGIRFVHNFPIVINSQSIIGKNVIIHPNVLIGGTRTKGKAPVIGDNCFLGNGCKIIGNCIIGSWTFISPGAFICKDVPSGSVVGFGVNNIISEKGEEYVQLYL